MSLEETLLHLIEVSLMRQLFQSLLWIKQKEEAQS